MLVVAYFVLNFQVSGLKSQVSSLRSQVSGFRSQVSGFSPQASAFASFSLRIHGHGDEDADEFVGFFPNGIYE